jgi:hypothetical protein
MASSDKTTNYLLNKFSGGDYWKREDWNADMEIIDGAMKALDDEVSSLSEEVSDLDNDKTDTALTNGGDLLGVTSIADTNTLFKTSESPSKFVKLITGTSVSYAHDGSGIPDYTYFEQVAYKPLLDKVENLLYTEGGTINNGWRKWNDGRYEAWGYGSSLTVTLEHTCTNTVIPVITAGRSVADTTVSFTNESTTGFTIVKSGNANYFSWRIENRWK